MQPIFFGHPWFLRQDLSSSVLHVIPAQAIAAGGLKYTVSLALR
jgi:hypothetical protein